MWLLQIQNLGYSAYGFESLFLDLGWHALISHNSVQQGHNALQRGGSFLLLIL